MRLTPTKQEQALMLEASFLRTELQLAKERIATLESQVETLATALVKAKRKHEPECLTNYEQGMACDCPGVGYIGEANAAIDLALASVRK